MVDAGEEPAVGVHEWFTELRLQHLHTAVNTGLLQSITGLLQSITGLLQSTTGLLQSITGLLQSITGLLQSITGCKFKGILCLRESQIL